MKAELRNTIILAACAIILSVTSTVTMKMGKGELYPFSDYKLYSHPDGLSKKTVAWHLYVKTSTDTSFQRVGNIDRKSFDDYDFYYAARSILNDSLSDQHTKKRRARALGEFLFPGDNQYEIVSETYDLDESCKGNYIYADTTSLLRF